MNAGALPLPPPAPAGSADLAESVAWLPCRRRGTGRVYAELEGILARDATPSRPLLLILENLEMLDGPLSAFVLGLEAIARQSGRRVLIADASGIVPLLVPDGAGSRVTVLRTEGWVRSGRPVLIVDVSGPCGDVLAGVLDSFGIGRALVESGPEARRALRGLEPGLVVADLDHARTEPLELAGLCRGGGPSVVGLTFLKDPWAQPACRRLGFARVLSKPAPIAEILGSLG